MADRKIEDFPTLVDASDEDLLLISSESETYSMPFGSLRSAVTDAATTAAEQAEASATAAAKSATQAASSASAASTSATNASNDASAAATSATNAAASATSAHEYSSACLTVYNATKEERKTVENLAEETESLHDETETYYNTVLGYISNQVPIQQLTAAEYAAISPNPQTLYLVKDEHPENYLCAYYPLTADYNDALDSSKAASAVGCQGFGDWDSTGASLKTLADAVSILLTDLVDAGTYYDSARINQVTISNSGYTMIGQAGNARTVQIPLSSRPFVAGTTYTIQYSAGSSAANGGSIRLYNSTDSTTLDILTLPSEQAGSASATFTAPDNIANFDYLEFYGEMAAYTRSVTITSITGAVAGTQHQNYIVLPSNLFADADYSNGISFSIEIKPNALADWTRIFQFYDPTTAGDFYATQGVTTTGYYNSTTIQQMGYGNYQCVTAGVWHTFIFTVSPSELKIYVDGDLKTTATDSGSTLSSLLAGLSGFTQNYLGNSLYADDDFAGLMRNFKMYNKSLSATEIGQLDTTPSVALYWGTVELASSAATN